MERGDAPQLKAGDRRRPRTQVTLRDLAEETGLALSTVSRALSKPGRVSAETSAVVREAAVRLGYRTATASVLSKRRTALLGLVVSDVTNPFFAELMRGAREAGSELGYTLMIIDTQESADRERATLEQVVGGLDAVVMASSRMSDSAIRMIAKQIPTVVLNRHVVGIPSLITDTDTGMRQAMRRLSTLGHSRVVYVSGPEASWANGIRWRSLQDAAASQRITVSTLPPSPPTEAGGRAAADAILQSGATAVLCYNDIMAIGVIHELSRRGVDVPGQVSVVGWDNIRGAEWVRPLLATVAAPLRALGRAGVRELVKYVDTGTPPIERPVVLPTKFLARGSIGDAVPR
ncbi:MAG: LacI family DNA-binding transcriptional regulator [Salinibacterium sp.]|nr:LacI family DNA-binding transcriptional regulator [Salinibacterium sp.]